MKSGISPKLLRLTVYHATIYHASNYNIPLNLEFEIPIQSVLRNNLYNKFALSNNRVTITL